MYKLLTIMILNPHITNDTIEVGPIDLDKFLPGLLILFISNAANESLSCGIGRAWAKTNYFTYFCQDAVRKLLSAGLLAARVTLFIKRVTH